jgi:hypothetical protein
MTQPNFLQVANSLQNAITFCGANPGYRAASSYAAQLSAMASTFEEATRQTDARYTRWRQRVGEELLRLREIRMELQRIAELADEHGYTLPTRRILYTERDDLLRVVNETTQALTPHSSDWEWIPARLSALKQLVELHDRKLREAGLLYTEYTVAIKQRVSAYEVAVRLIEEFCRDARSDVRQASELDAVSLEVR